MKTCTRCGTEKPLDQFDRDKRVKRDGRRAACKPCTRAWASGHYQEKRKDSEWLQQRYELRASYSKVYKLRKYGLTIEQFEQMLVEQNYCCGICQRHQDEFDRSFAVDHCHDTGKVRGLLCISCNRGLGYLGDDILRLQMAIKYLEGSGER